MAETKIKETQVSDLDHTDSTAIHDDTAAEISVVTEKTVPVDADLILIEDSAAANAKKRVQVGNLPAGSATFLGLTDVDPSTYSGQAGKSAVVNTGEDGMEFVLVSGSGGSGGTPDFSWWNPYAPPSSASSYNDEFDGEEGAGAPTGWTEYDTSSCLTVSEEEHGLQILKTSATQEIGGVYQSVPSGWDWTVYTKVDISQYQSGDTQAGIFFSEDIASNPTTCKHEFFGIYIGSAGYGIRKAYFTDYNSSSTEDSQIHSPPIGTSTFLRVRLVDFIVQDYQFGYSLDGRTWTDIYTNTRNFTPTTFGLFIRSNQGATDVRLSFPFFRVDEDNYTSLSILPANRTNGFFTA
jgi:hypothetical protein